jgi:hypothetical protein
MVLAGKEANKKSSAISSSFTQLFTNREVFPWSSDERKS